MPAVFRVAVFRGAQEAYKESGLSEGIQFTLIEALVHPVDASERKFIEVGKTAVACWINENY
jgi:hypothetical protein